MMRLLRFKLRALFNRRQLERDLEDELSYHQERLQTASSSRLPFGNPGRIREATREVWTFVWLEDLVRNVRHSCRTLRRTPVVTVVAVVSLALGIGSNVAIFSLFNELLLRPLPVPQADELVVLGAPGPKPGASMCNRSGNCDYVFSYPMFLDLQQHQDVLTGIAAHRSFEANLAYDGQTLSGEGMRVSGNYFQVLELRPALGRLLVPNDTAVVGETGVAVLSHAYWISRFGGDPFVLNETLTVNGQALTIVGVAPEGFTGATVGIQPEVFVPITLRGMGNDAFEGRRQYWVYLFARLRPGVSIEQATTAINGPYHSIVREVEAPLQVGMSDATMERFLAKEVTLEEGSRGQSRIHDDAEAPMFLLTAVTGLVLLIACANVSNLLLVRAANRRGEMAVRVSMGANRRQLLTQLLSESCLLAFVGAVAGLAVAVWTLDLVASLLPPEDAANLSLRIDGTALLFAGALALGTGIFVGIFPAFQSAGRNTILLLKGQSGQSTPAGGAARFRGVLVTVQVGLAMALLVSAGLFLRSLVNINHVDLGLDTESLVTFTVAPSRNGYTPEQSRPLFERIEEELRSMPGVVAATASRVQILSGNAWNADVDVQGFEGGPDVDQNVRRNMVGPGYFRALGIPMIAGREFTASDAGDAPLVVIVNQAFARKFDMGDEVIGKRLGFRGPENGLDYQIVGLVQDAKYSQVRDAVPPQFFTPYRQESLGTMAFYVRTALDPLDLAAAIPPVVARLDPNLPVERTQTMQQHVRQNVAGERITGTLATSFALLSTLLAAIGLFGMLAYSVAQRTREFGLRMALGADRTHVRRMVFRQVLSIGLGGIAVGAPLGWGLGRLGRSLLYEVASEDPIVMAVAAGVLILTTLLAGYLPVRWASRVDPMTALRYE